MIPYYLFMGLLIVTLILWAVLAILPEEPKDDTKSDPEAGTSPGDN